MINNPDAPTEEVFLAHFAQANPNSAFFWTDKANGLTYLYDLSINQLQVTPSTEPYSGRVNEVNKQLWKILPPQLLDVNGDWEKAWFRAMGRLDIASAKFILEQGFDVNTTDEQGYTALMYAAGFFGGEFDLIKLLVESGANLNSPGNTVDELIELGQRSATSSAEASEARSIAAYLRSRERANRPLLG
ncbi:ankyrin repeat domain-containing protein [Spirosoma areae]